MPGESKYSKRGVSSSKEDVHKAIANIDKGLFPKAFCKIVPDITMAAMKSIATLCMPMEQVQNHLWHMFTGKRLVIFLYGKALPRMPLL